MDFLNSYEFTKHLSHTINLFKNKRRSASSPGFSSHWCHVDGLNDKSIGWMSGKDKC